MTGPGSPCDWCGDPIPVGKRRDSRFCSTLHRQSAHRFEVGARRRLEPGPTGSPPAPVRLAYADPPYPGLSGYYRDHPDYAGEVDHAELVVELAGFDGWALSTSARSLAYVLELAVAAEPREVRVAAWLRGARPHRSAHGALASWEPVLYVAGRSVADRPLVDGSIGTVDSLELRSVPRLSDPRRVVGAKPPGFSRWVFELLGADPVDELVDMFPGSGAVSRAWDIWRADPSRRTSLDASPGPSR